MKLYIDGGCTNNGQLDQSLRVMSFVVCSEDKKILVDEIDNGGSNNIAEFIALKEAILYCVKNDIMKVDIFTDSRNNTNWFRKVKNRKMNNYDKVKSIKAEIDNLCKDVKVNLIWLPRERNLAGIYLANKQHYAKF